MPRGRRRGGGWHDGDVANDWCMVECGSSRSRMDEFELLTVVVECDASGLKAPDVRDGDGSALGKIEPA
jgi:hypothetical protein